MGCYAFLGENLYCGDCVRTFLKLFYKSATKTMVCEFHKRVPKRRQQLNNGGRFEQLIFRRNRTWERGINEKVVNSRPMRNVSRWAVALVEGISARSSSKVKEQPKCNLEFTKTFWLLLLIMYSPPETSYRQSVEIKN